MSRFLPKSLLGQVMLALALGLLVAQIVSGALLYRASEQRREAGLVSTIAFRLVASEGGLSRDDSRRLRDDLRGEMRMPFRRGEGPRSRRRVEYMAEFPALRGDVPLPDVEQKLGRIARDQGLTVGEIRVVRRDRELAREISRSGPNGESRSRDDLVIAGKQAQDGSWAIVRAFIPPRPRGVLGGIVLQTAVIFVVLLGLLYFVLRRITRPLHRLTRRVSAFASNPEQAGEIEESGPQDMRRLIAAHNAMEARIAAMLDEKDVMLGAIGHDLKTPLAALRVRIESVTDENQRARMADSIEDITQTLDDILDLARIGRASEPMEPTELAALVGGVVEEYEDMGQPVELRGSQRVTLPMHATWLRRAIRNLVGNALRYGKSARIEVERDGGTAIVRIEDDGPGIPERQIAAMMEPFQRGEASRNRATGGAGLGLTLARAIAEQHGGNLNLSNLPEGGLRAEIRIPI